ncbi:MAG: GMC family oxidoreductase [Bdellovibrionales bacterium]|nr:GMC family oxidoreductase [Bdellovibrionales bacterium]
MDESKHFYDLIIIGGGISGSFIAEALSQDLRILILEAGINYKLKEYPIHEVHTSAKMYWGGGIEFNTDANIAFLRPKVVGGGSVINGALVDRFDDIAFDDWKGQTKVNFFNSKDMGPWYEKAESKFQIQYIPEEGRNGNAEIFAQGMKAKGFSYSPLRRAQKNCAYEEGNDCIECLSGCRIGSKQMMSVSTLERALQNGVELISQFEVENIEDHGDCVSVWGKHKKQRTFKFRSKKVVMAAGAIGNVRLLFKSGFGEKIPGIGKNFYTHPQYMNLGIFEKKIQSFKGALQAYKSSEPRFRQWGFKLENVFAPPAGLSMLIPGFGKKHMRQMKKIAHMSCIEVAIRDTEPGKMEQDRNGNFRIIKTLNAEDRKRRKLGLEIINDMFESCGASEIIEGKLPVGLHLMGGCGLGHDANESAVNPEFKLFDHKNIYVADSSIFPSAPGINPSLTVMALSLKATDQIAKGF